MLKKSLIGTAILSLAVSVAGLTGCGNEGSNGTGPAEVAATVNGAEIPVSKIDTVIEQQLKQQGPAAQPLTQVELAALRLQVLDQLIQEEALYQRAQKEKVIPTDDEVRQALQQQLQQSGLSQDEYQKQLAESGKTEEQLRQEIKRTLAIQKLQEKIGATIPAPTDAEIRKYFEENKEQLIAPRGVELSDIIVDPQNNGAADDAVGAEAAERKAREIAAALGAGSDFATLARTRSEDTSGMQGGLIGFFSDQRLAQTFPSDVANKLLALNIGQRTEPIQSADGRWHIFMVNNKQDQNRPLTYEEVSPRIAKQITDQRKQVVFSAMLLDVMSSSNIKNFLAARIVEHPDTFGAMRPSPLTTQRPQTGAPAQPGNTNAPANTNDAGAAANTNEAQPEAQPEAPANTNN